MKNFLRGLMHSFVCSCKGHVKNVLNFTSDCQLVCFERPAALACRIWDDGFSCAKGGDGSWKYVATKTSRALDILKKITI